MKLSIAAATLLTSARWTNAQQVGGYENEEKPYITLKECTLSGGCTSRQAKLTLDANWRWVHDVNGYENCYTGNEWDAGKCSDPVACAQNCALEGVTRQKYESTYGVKQVQDGVRLNFVTNHQYGTNVGSRLYVMEDDDNYAMFHLKNREFSFEVDVSELYCGMNGAMYFSEMEANGGKGKGNNNAGAKYGTGYCDAQCPHDIKFIDGEANVIDWKPNEDDLDGNMGAGKYGACCAEMDIWEANSMATAYTPHTCSVEKLYRCEGIDCGDNDKGERYEGVCDKDGCDINPYRMGNTEFYGRGPEYAVNTLKPMTLVTQFLTVDGTDSGDLSEIRRFYVQDGKVVHSPPSTILGPGKDTDAITDKFCDDKKDLFGDVKHFQELGGMAGMGESLDRGHVMIFSLWDDVHVNMLWLDSAYPLDKPETDPGIKRGDCPGGETSTPTYLRETYPNGGVVFKNAAVGEIGSTFEPPAPTPPTPEPAPSSTPPPQCGASGCCSQNFASCVTWCGTTESECLNCNQDVHWICGEQNDCKARWNDCTNDKNSCCDGLTCVDVNPGYSQCRYVEGPAPTAPPTLPLPTPAPQPVPTRPPFVSEGCYSKNHKHCLPSDYDSEEGTCGLVWLPEGERNNCVALWGKCTQSGSCCGDTVCFGDNGYAACVLPSDDDDDDDDTPSPSKSPTPPPNTTPTSSPTECNVCDDKKTPSMENKNKDCPTFKNLDKKCNKNTGWTRKGFCRLSCYNAGYGYPGDVCCSENESRARTRNLRVNSD